jgi:hypothetical protein
MGQVLRPLSGDDSGYGCDAFRRAANALAPEALADEAELTIRGEPLP